MIKIAHHIFSITTRSVAAYTLTYQNSQKQKAVLCGLEHTPLRQWRMALNLEYEKGRRAKHREFITTILESCGTFISRNWRKDGLRLFKPILTGPLRKCFVPSCFCMRLYVMSASADQRKVRFVQDLQPPTPFADRPPINDHL